MARQIKYEKQEIKDYNNTICFIPGYNKITMKSQLAQLLQNTTHEHIMPKQFILPNQINEFNEWSKTVKTRFIVKPSSGSLGNGIELYDNPQQVNEYSKQLKHKKPRKDETKATSVVQEYLDSDLINNKKYDVRIYVLETGIDPVSLYIYKDGIIRLSKYDYDESKILDPKVPILERRRMFATNTALIKNITKDYNQIVWHTDEYFEYKQKQDQNYDKNYFWDQIFQIVQETFSQNVIQRQLQELETDYIGKKYYQFPRKGLRLYGFDFLVLKNNTLKLLEINNNPSTGVDCSNYLYVLKRLYTDLYTMAGIRDYNSTPLCNNEKCKKAFLGKIIPDNLKEDEKLALLQIAEERQYMGNFVPVKPESQIFSLGKYNYLLEKYYDKIDDITKDLINYSQRDLIN